MTQVTILLRNLADGSPGAAEALFPVVYSELRALAGALFANERAEHTLQPTALVHEAYVRLAAAPGEVPRSSLQFRALAATVMRHVLVDHARARGAARRGGDRTRVELAEIADVAASVAGTAGAARTIDVEAIDAALTQLAELAPRTARVVELRFFAGLTHAEIAQVLECSLSSVEREWRFARAWLGDRLSTEDQA